MNQQEKDKIVRKLIDTNTTISTMESCTSGLIASMITDTEGASAVFPGGYVTYLNKTKILCGVDEKIIKEHGERFQRFHHLLQPSRTGGLSRSRKKRHVRGTRQAYKAWDPADTAQSFHIIKTFRLIRIKFRYHLLQYSCRLLQF